MGFFLPVLLILACDRSMLGEFQTFTFVINFFGISLTALLYYIYRVLRTGLVHIKIYKFVIGHVNITLYFLNALFLI